MSWENDRALKHCQFSQYGTPESVPSRSPVRRPVKVLQSRNVYSFSFCWAGTYFVTSATFSRRRLFQISTTAELFLKTLQQYRHAGHYKLHAFVVMPDHIHLLLSPQALALERVMALIKGGFSHQLGSKLPVWQRGFTDHRVRDGDEFHMRRQYIHDNPVRAKLVELPGLYPYSSAYRSRKEKRTSAAKAVKRAGHLRHG